MPETYDVEAQEFRQIPGTKDWVEVTEYCRIENFLHIEIRIFFDPHAFNKRYPYRVAAMETTTQEAANLSIFEVYTQVKDFMNASYTVARKALLATEATAIGLIGMTPEDANCGVQLDEMVTFERVLREGHTLPDAIRKRYEELLTPAPVAA